MNNDIAIRIYTGRQGETFNMTPTVSVGNTADLFTPFVPAKVKEKEVWILQHRRHDTLYAKFSKDYLTNDGQKAQVLLCLFVSAGVKLGGGKSPLGLLNDLQGLLLVYGMRSGRLTDQPVIDTPFGLLVNRQKTMPLTMPLPVMNGSQPETYQVNNDVALDKLMRKSHYPALCQVAWLEIGRECHTSINLTQTIINPQLVEEPNQSAGIGYNSVASAPHLSGVALGEEEKVEVVSNDKKMSKNKLLIYIGIAAACLLACFLAFGLTGGEGGAGTDTDIIVNENATEDADMAVAVGEDEFMDAAEEPATDQKMDAVLAAVEAAEKAKKEEEAKKKAEEEANKKKAEEEAKKKKAEEEANKKKAEEEQRKQAWQSQIRKHAQNCPIYLSSGGKLASISFNDHSVTCTVEYGDLTMYDLSEGDKVALRNDVSVVKSKYCSGLPSGVMVTVVQKDRAGRSIK